jgi:sec-independent protein translocase protein TatB
MGTPPTIEMANIGMADTLILMVLALVVFGPRRLPQIGRQIGKLMYEFRKASNDFKFQMEEELRQSEEADRRKKAEEDRQRNLAAAPQSPQLGQPSEAAPSTAESSASSSESPAPSPYPGETTYPDIAANSTQPEDLTAAAVEAARLRIQPPSTGEIVASNRPGALAQQTDLFDPAPTPTAANAPTTPPSNAPDAISQAERSEPATHHG